MKGRPGAGFVAAHWTVIVCSVLAGVLVALYFVRSDFPYAHDDAFISFVYADNLARGAGLVFNDGQRVWAYTSPLQTLTLAACSFAGLTLTAAGPLLSLAWISLTAVAVFHLARALLSPVPALLAALYFLTWGAGYEFLGLESNLLVLLQCWFLVAAVAGRARTTAILGSLCCLARPDALLLVAPVLFAGSETRRFRNLALFALPGVLWLAFAFAYYGDVLPNSLHAKAQSTGAVAYFRHAVGWFTSFSPTRTPSPMEGWSQNVSATPRILITALLVACSLASLLNPRLRRRPALLYALVLYPGVLIAAYTAIGAPAGHVWEIYSGHFFFALSYTTSVLYCVPRAVERLRGPRSLTKPLVAIATLALVLLIGANAVKSIDYLEQNKTSYWGGSRHATYLEISTWLNRNLAAGTSVAMVEVGTIKYYSPELEIVDLTGLTTKVPPGNERDQSAQILVGLEPEYVLLRGKRPEFECTADLRYRGVQHFPPRGFKAFTLLKRD